MSAGRAVVSAFRPWRLVVPLLVLVPVIIALPDLVTEAARQDVEMYLQQVDGDGVPVAPPDVISVPCTLTNEASYMRILIEDPRGDIRSGSVKVGFSKGGIYKSGTGGAALGGDSKYVFLSRIIELPSDIDSITITYSPDSGARSSYLETTVVVDCRSGPLPPFDAEQCDSCLTDRYARIRRAIFASDDEREKAKAECRIGIRRWREVGGTWRPSRPLVADERVNITIECDNLSIDDATELVIDGLRSELYGFQSSPDRLTLKNHPSGVLECSFRTPGFNTTVRGAIRLHIRLNQGAMLVVNGREYAAADAYDGVTVELQLEAPVAIPGYAACRVSIDGWYNESGIWTLPASLPVGSDVELTLRFENLTRDAATKFRIDRPASFDLPTFTVAFTNPPQEAGKQYVFLMTDPAVEAVAVFNAPAGSGTRTGTIDIPFRIENGEGLTINGRDYARFDYRHGFTHSITLGVTWSEAIVTPVPTVAPPVTPVPAFALNLGADTWTAGESSRNITITNMSMNSRDVMLAAEPPLFTFDQAILAVPGERVAAAAMSRCAGDESLAGDTPVQAAIVLRDAASGEELARAAITILPGMSSGSDDGTGTGNGKKYLLAAIALLSVVLLVLLFYVVLKSLSRSGSGAQRTSYKVSTDIGTAGQVRTADQGGVTEKEQTTPVARAKDNELQQAFERHDAMLTVFQDELRELKEAFGHSRREDLRRLWTIIRHQQRQQLEFFLELPYCLAGTMIGRNLALDYFVRKQVFEDMRAILKGIAAGALNEKDAERVRHLLNSLDSSQSTYERMFNEPVRRSAAGLRELIDTVHDTLVLKDVPESVEEAE
ncbi:hypothetical protein JW905_19660, partial [bacterium]|nr:hypothetical protein [candidate division CSSED10-310 bacterium]